jgi:hypothetical protein
MPEDGDDRSVAVVAAWPPPTPQTADPVFRKILAEPHFIWAEHSQARLRNRKPWCYEHESRPHVAVTGARLSELIGR